MGAFLTTRLDVRGGMIGELNGFLAGLMIFLEQFSMFGLKMRNHFTSLFSINKQDFKIQRTIYFLRYTKAANVWFLVLELLSDVRTFKA